MSRAPTPHPRLFKRIQRCDKECAEIAHVLRMFLPDWKTATSPIKVWIELIEFGRNISLRHIHEK